MGKTKECERCGERVRKIKWKEHLQEHENNPKLPCPDCSKVFANVAAWHKHTFRVHSRPLRCEKCLMTHTNLNRFMLHVHHAHEIKKYVCTLCDSYSTNVAGRLKAHVDITHLKQFRYFCDTCCKGFVHKSMLADHFNTHSGETPHQCEKCGKNFRMKTSLRAHLAMHHTDAFSFVCNICRKGFLTRSGLVAHAKLHEDEDRFTCEFCGKRLTTLATLREHRRRHTGESPFSCHLCPRSFYAKKHLSRHLHTHSGAVDKVNHTCMHCGRGFSSVKGFQQHAVKCKLFYSSID